MIFTENIYFLILFTLPAAFNVIYNSYIRPVPVIKEDKSVELAECVIFCLVVFFANIIMMNDEIKLFSQYITIDNNELDAFIKKTQFEYIDFITKYFIVNLITSIIIIIVWYSIGQWTLRRINNFINNLLHRPTEYKYSDVWRNVFETAEFVDINNCIIKIERSGILISAGLINLYSAPTETNKEFLLYNTDLIKQLFEDDAKKKLNKRMFKQAICEYYDIQNDVLIKFYDTTEYDKKYATDEKEPE